MDLYRAPGDARNKEDEDELGRHRVLAIACFFASFALQGAMFALPTQSARVLALLLTGSSAAMWFTVDAMPRSVPYFSTGRWLMFVGWPILGPFYIISSRGFVKGIGASVIVGLGLIVAGLLGTFIAGLISAT